MFLVLYLKSHHHTQSHLHFLLIVLCFTFRSGPILSYYMWRVRSVSRFFYLFIFFAYGFPVVLAPFVERTVFVLLYCFCFFVNDHLTIFLWVHFCTLFYSIDLFVYSFTNTSLFWLLYLYSKSWSQIVIVSVLQLYYSLSIIVVSILGLLPLHINFRISLLISTK